MSHTLSRIWRPTFTLAAAVLALLVLSTTGARAAAAGPDTQDYIVTLKPHITNVGATATQLASMHGGQVGFVYQHALRGFSVSLPPQAVVALANNAQVVSVEPDGVASIVDTQSPTPSWGLDRIDQRGLPMNGAYGYSGNAAGVTAYIIDTGIMKTHSDFGGRAVDGYDFVSGDADASDCNGHGTHVAGTVGGSSYGVAKGVTLVAVRVLNCQGSGTWGGVIAGIDWVTGHHVTGAPAVANMSLGGGSNGSVDTAVRNSIADGITYAVAAGNSDADACNYSPARTAEALTVGATTSSDGEASFSNYGACVDILAPGVNITSAWKDGRSKTISGTSMASPHVAGAAALYLAANAGSPAQVESGIESAATAGVIINLSASTPNLLLYVGGSGSPPATTPTGSITGVVTDGSDGIVGATVATGTGQSTTTVVGGAYSLTGVPEGTASVTASAGGFVSATQSAQVNAGGTSSVNFALTRASTATSTRVQSISCTTSGGRGGTKDLLVTVSLFDNLGAAVGGASVTVSIAKDSQTWGGTSTTSTSGNVTFKLMNAASGTYTTTVTGVTSTPAWDGQSVPHDCDKP
jgi:subtilisin family serine protease